MLLAAAWLVWALRSHPATLTMLDVGQGLSVLFEDDGGWQLLYDGGVGDRALPELGAVLPPWDTHLNAVAVSHFDRDHMEGLIAVLRRYRVDEVWWYETDKSNEVVEQLRAAVAASGARVVTVTAGWQRALASGWRVTALHPADPPRGAASHDATVTLELTLPAGDPVLLTGDLELVNENDLVDFCQASRVVRCRPPLSVLQVSHQGSGSSTSSSFLDYWRPVNAWIPVGAKNPYGTRPERRWSG